MKSKKFPSKAAKAKPGPTAKKQWCHPGQNLKRLCLILKNDSGSNRLIKSLENIFRNKNIHGYSKKREFKPVELAPPSAMV